MKNINRRSFIGKASMGLGGALTLSNIPALLRAAGPEFLNISIGFQTFPIRDMLAKDFSGTLKTMAGFGYQLVEDASPAGYAQIGFGFAAGMKAGEIRNIINGAGLNCPSCHFGKAACPRQTGRSIEFAHGLGLTQMICSTFGLPQSSGLNDYYADADKLNKAAEKIKSAGMETGFHNHETEFTMTEGQLIYEVLMKRFDPALVKMQFQTEVINLGYKAATYFKRFPGRFISAHLSDWTADKKEVAIGKGVIDWREFFATARGGGVENYFVEMDFDKFKDSAINIKKI